MNITTTATTRPAAPEWLRELADAQTDYEERLGWPVTIEIAHRRLVMAIGERMDAITMPAGLGGHALAELRNTMLAGPVIAGPGGWWTFLTQPATAPRPAVPAELSRVKVHLVPRGARVVIPLRRDAQEWIRRPQDALPPWSAVIGATRRAAALTSTLAPATRSSLPAAHAASSERNP